MLHALSRHCLLRMDESNLISKAHMPGSSWGESLLSNSHGTTEKNLSISSGTSLKCGGMWFPT